MVSQQFAMIMRVMRTGMWAASSFCAKMSSACARVGFWSRRIDKKSLAGVLIEIRYYVDKKAQTQSDRQTYDPSPSPNQAGIFWAVTATPPGAVVLIDRLDMKNVMFNKYFAGCNYARTTTMRSGASCTSETDSLICIRTERSEKIVNWVSSVD